MSADEWGIFNDEGCLEAKFASKEQAEAAKARYYPNDDAYVAPVCRQHDESEASCCEECEAEDDSEG